MTDFSQIGTELQEPLRMLALLAGHSRLSREDVQQIRTYHDLLEDEWSGRASALEYLTKANHLLDSQLRMQEAAGTLLAQNFSREELAVVSLFQGICANLKDDVPVQCLADASVKEETLSGNPRMLGMALREMIYALQEAMENGGDGLCLSLQTVKLTENDFLTIGSSRPAGKYLMAFLQIQQGGGFPAVETLRPLQREIQDSSEEKIPLPLLESMLFWFGTMELHEGAVFLAGQELTDGIVLLLPLLEAATPMNIRAGVRNGHPETILLVDDEDVIWDVVFSMLTDLGYTVVLAENGQDAVDIFRENPQAIDLVLLDMLMPVLNGRDAFFKLKEISPDARVLLVSGYVKEEDVVDVLQNGAKGFLRKPYRLRDLAVKIREILAE